MRRSSAESRQAVIDSTADLLSDRGASALNVNAVMERAGISRTIFYRHFPEVYEVVEALIEQFVTHMAARSGAWLRVASAVGTPDQIYPNLIRSAAAIQPYAPLVLALHDATGIDERLRRIWRERLVQPRIDAVALAIRRDQAAGAISVAIDPDAVALALSLMNEQLLLELICRNGAAPEDFARVAAPIWQAALFAGSR